MAGLEMRKNERKKFRQLESVESVGDKTNSKEDKLKM